MIPLLPYEKRLAEMLDVSEEVYQQWKAITLKRSIEHPAKAPTCGFIVPIVVNLAISVGLTLLSSLLFPAQQQQQPGRIVTKRSRGEGRTSNQRLSPRYGFDSVQEPARVGQFIPVVIAKRENGLGGVRVAMPLIWSQMLAYKGSQMLRGIFLAGAANMAAAAWDPKGWAFGNNTLGTYAYTSTGITRGSRYSIYWSRNGGRIVSADLIAGRQANRDTGNFQNNGAPDVFSVNTGNNDYKTAFCMTESPSTSAVFGLYGWCPNAMLHRASITVQPTIVAGFTDGDPPTVRTDDDASALVETWKGKFHWSMRGGLTGYKEGGVGSWEVPAGNTYDIVTEDVRVGDSLRYQLSGSTDADTIIKFNTSNSRINSNDAEAEERMAGVAASVVGVQNAADSALVQNELYRIGSCWAVLEERIPEDDEQSVFVSDSENDPVGNGNSMEYVFTVVRAGTVQFVGSKILVPEETGETILPIAYDPDDDLSLLSSGTEDRYKVCSAAAQIFRMSIASISAVREFKVCEIVIKSRVGISVNGLIGFRSCEKIETINARAGQNQVGNTTPGNELSVSRYDSSGTQVVTKTRRYSVFRLQYSSDLGLNWNTFNETFAIAGISGEEVYNYLRIDFPSYKRWAVRLVPLSSWEIRTQGEGLTQMFVLDTDSNEQIAQTFEEIRITTTGYQIDPSDYGTGRISHLEPNFDIGLGYSDPSRDSMLDGYGRFAEVFPYDNVQTTVGTRPEHEITQVNYYDDLEKTPSYADIACVGVNISAGVEFNSLQSFSGFCNNGYEMPRLLNGDTIGASHLFPDWLRELMTNPNLGAFPPTQLAQIDRASFQAAAQWCQDREYFYDAVEDEPLNILEWATETAQAHLLKLIRLGGIYYLRPAIEFSAPIEIKAQFNNGNIEEGSFKLNSIDYITRQKFAVLVKWREESNSVEAPLFARERVALVREAGTSPSAPVRELDLSKWCTNYRQAIDAACYLIRFVTLSDHNVIFRTTPDMLAAELRSGGCFKLDLDVINYNSAVQGFIQADGRIVTSRPDLLPTADGYYPGLTWDMIGDPQQQDIVILDGLGSPINHFFAIANASTKQRTYEIKKIDIDAEGAITINAFHHPTNSSGVSLLGVNWTTYVTDANWTIEL